MIPIGATVDITTPPGALKPNRWRGVVTGRPGPYSIEIDGRLTAPANLAKVVGEMDEHETLRLVQDELTKQMTRNHELLTERDALRELVVAQATTNAELAGELSDMREALKDAEEERDAEDEINAENLAGVREDFKRYEAEVAHRMEDLLLLFMGERRPVRPIEPPELRRLAEFAFEGV